MYKISITGYLAHDNKLFNATCKTCGMLYDKTVGVLCPKCGAPLYPLLDRNGNPMDISEGTVYLSRTDDEQKRHRQSTKDRKNGMLPVYRFALFSFTDKKTGILNPHPLHQYLAKGRRVFMEFNTDPIICFFNSKDPDFPVQCEIKYIYMDGKDTIELQDKKREIAPTAAPVQSVTSETVVAQSTQTNPYINMDINTLCNINPTQLPAAQMLLLQQALIIKSTDNTQPAKTMENTVAAENTDNHNTELAYDIPEDDIPF